jgi:two-component system chemotaxis response regulator CheB
MPMELVVVGSSAGGLEALRILLSGLPGGAFTPVVIAQHQSPTTTGESFAELLQKRCALDVRVANDKDELVPGAVLVGPPDYHILIEPGSVALSIDERVMFSRPSVDVLFESAANTYGTRVVGVVLTGANEDGAQGLAAIRRRGGIAVVQEPATAKVATMPARAVEVARPHQVLPLEEIAPFLVRISGSGVRT